MSQNGQTHFKNLSAFSAKCLICVGPFWDYMNKYNIFSEKYIFGSRYGNDGKLIIGDWHNCDRLIKKKLFYTKL